MCTDFREKVRKRQTDRQRQRDISWCLLSVPERGSSPRPCWCTRWCPSLRSHPARAALFQGTFFLPAYNLCLKEAHPLLTCAFSLGGTAPSLAPGNAGQHSDLGPFKTVKSAPPSPPTPQKHKNAKREGPRGPQPGTCSQCEGETRGQRAASGLQGGAWVWGAQIAHRSAVHKRPTMRIDLGGPNKL